MTQPITDEQFWQEVEKIGWGRKILKSGTVQKMLSIAWGPEKSVVIRNRCRFFEKTLNVCLTKWSRQNEKPFGLGDDSFGDLVSHIVGLGRAEYEAVMANPELGYKRAIKRDFEECFNYCLPYDDTHKEELGLADMKDKVIKEAAVALEKAPLLEPLIKGILEHVEADHTETSWLYSYRNDVAAQGKTIQKKLLGTLETHEAFAEGMNFVNGWLWSNYISDKAGWALAHKLRADQE